MIRYNIKTGDKIANATARGIRDQAYKPFLKRMSCGVCREDTIIDFSLDHNGYVRSEIFACCDEFNDRILEKLNPPEDS